MHGRVTTPSDVIWIEMSTKQAINNVARWSNAENLDILVSALQGTEALQEERCYESCFSCGMGMANQLMRKHCTRDRRYQSNTYKHLPILDHSLTLISLIISQVDPEIIP